jgi:hypothetical protein
MTDDRTDEALPEALGWLKDAPLFIDAANLDRFYDAVVRPTFKEAGPRKIKISEETRRELRGALKASAKAHLPSWLSTILSAGVDIGAEVEGKTADASASAQELELEAITTPQRQLEQLAVFYLLRLKDRLLVGGIDAPMRWQAEASAMATPRALTFLDLPVGTILMPMSAEFTNGRVVTFFDRLRAASGENPPPFREADKGAYWAWFKRHFDAGRAIRVVEEAAAAEAARIEWIDFRAPLNGVVDTMHLHVAARGKYNTGTFAYRLIGRCVGHGMRIVGTLKDGPDINVMAIYEK